MTQIDEVRLLKALHKVSYKAIAEELGIKTNSLYNWMRGSYSLSQKRQEALQAIINRYKELNKDG